MALYEGNFIKLISLAPAVAGSPAREPALSRSPRDLDLYLSVDSVTKRSIIK
jgi:hypothetical protein